MCDAAKLASNSSSVGPHDHAAKVPTSNNLHTTWKALLKPLQLIEVKKQKKQNNRTGPIELSDMPRS